MKPEPSDQRPDKSPTPAPAPAARPESHFVAVIPEARGAGVSMLRRSLRRPPGQQISLN